MKKFGFWLGCTGAVLGVTVYVYAVTATLSLTWDAAPAGDPRVAVNIYRQENCIGPFVYIGNTPVPNVIFTQTDLVLGRQYCWYATAIDGSGESDPSNMVTAICRKRKGRITCF